MHSTFDWIHSTTMATKTTTTTMLFKFASSKLNMLLKKAKQNWSHTFGFGCLHTFLDNKHMTRGFFSSFWRVEDEEKKSTKHTIHRLNMLFAELGCFVCMCFVHLSSSLFFFLCSVSFILSPTCCAIKWIAYDLCRKWFVSLAFRLHSLCVHCYFYHNRK